LICNEVGAQDTGEGRVVKGILGLVGLEREIKVTERTKLARGGKKKKGGVGN
jgi:hypothetical protein